MAERVTLDYASLVAGTKAKRKPPTLTEFHAQIRTAVGGRPLSYGEIQKANRAYFAAYPNAPASKAQRRDPYGN